MIHHWKCHQDQYEPYMYVGTPMHLYVLQTSARKAKDVLGSQLAQNILKPCEPLLQRCLTRKVPYLCTKAPVSLFYGLTKTQLATLLANADSKLQFRKQPEYSILSEFSGMPCLLAPVAPPTMSRESHKANKLSWMAGQALHCPNLGSASWLPGKPAERVLRSR